MRLYRSALAGAVASTDEKREKLQKLGALDKQVRDWHARSCVAALTHKCVYCAEVRSFAPAKEDFLAGHEQSGCLQARGEAAGHVEIPVALQQDIAFACGMISAVCGVPACVFARG